MDKGLEHATKTIAEFLGGEIDVSHNTPVNGDVFVWKGAVVLQFRQLLGFKDIDSILIEHCKFHESFDWSRPVWMKFNELKFSFGSKEQMEFELHRIKITYHLNHGTITSFFNALFAGIDWFNSIEKSQKESEKKYTEEDLINIQEAYHKYMTDSFADEDTYIIEALQKKDFEYLDRRFKNDQELRKIYQKNSNNS